MNVAIESAEDLAEYTSFGGSVREVIEIDSLLTKKYWPFLFIGESIDNYALRIDGDLFEFHKTYLFSKLQHQLFKNFSVYKKQSSAYILIAYPSGNFYVGSSSDTRARLGTHRQLLRNKIHYKKKFVEEFERLGDKFVQAIVIYQEDVRSAQELEQRLIDRYRSNPKLTNCGMNAKLPSLGSKLSIERKQAIRETMINFWSDDEKRKAITAKLRISLSSPAVREKMSAKTKEYYRTHPEACKVFGDRTKALFERKDYRDAHSEKIKKAWANPELKQKLIEAKASISKKISIFGTAYASYNEAGRALNIDPTLIRHRVLSNLDTWKEWLMADNTGAPIPKETLSLDAATILWRKKQREAVANPDVRARMSEIKKRQVLDENVQRNMRLSRTNSKHVSVDGVIYQSTEEAARVLGLHGSTVRNRAESSSDTFKNWFYL